MRKEIEKKFGKSALFIGVDLACRMKWWQRLLVWLKLVQRGKFQDYSCSTVFKRNKDGSLEVVDVNYF